MEELRTPTHRPTRAEINEDIRREIKKIREKKRAPKEPLTLPPPLPSPSSPLSPSSLLSPPSLPPIKDEKRLLNAAEEREREREYAFAPSTSADTPASSTSENGWDQGDGRRADQVVVYDRLPDTVRQKLEPTKGTHFRFRHSSDEQALLQALTTAQQTATYQTTGKKDVILTSSDGRLLGNIHFLHMDSRDIHQPDKYYMKFYLFNFTDSDTLRQTKQRLLQFAEFFTSAPAPVHRLHPRLHFRRASRRSPRPQPRRSMRKKPTSRYRKTTRRHPSRRDRTRI